MELLFQMGTIISMESVKSLFAWNKYFGGPNILWHDLLLYRYVHMITSERPCLKALISVSDCSILTLKRYSESENQSVLGLYTYFWIHPIVLSVITKLKLKVLLRLHSMRLNLIVIRIAMVSVTTFGLSNSVNKSQSEKIGGVKYWTPSNAFVLLTTKMYHVTHLLCSNDP